MHPAIEARRPRTSTPPARPARRRTAPGPRVSAGSRPALRRPARPRCRTRYRPPPCRANNSRQAPAIGRATAPRRRGRRYGRQDGQHRQHAGREGQQHAGHQKQPDDRPELPGLQGGGQRRAVGIAGQRRARHGRRNTGFRLAEFDRRKDASRRVAAEAGQADVGAAAHRRITQALVGAALAGDDQAKSGARLLHRNRDAQHAAQGLHVLRKVSSNLTLPAGSCGAPSSAPAASKWNLSRYM